MNWFTTYTSYSSFIDICKIFILPKYKYNVKSKNPHIHIYTVNRWLCDEKKILNDSKYGFFSLLIN